MATQSLASRSGRLEEGSAKVLTSDPAQGRETQEQRTWMLDLCFELKYPETVLTTEFILTVAETVNLSLLYQLPTCQYFSLHHIAVLTLPP